MRIKAFSKMGLAGGVIMLAGLAGAASGTTITLDASLPPEVGVRLTGNRMGSSAFRVISALGDFNGDGIDDLAIGDPGSGGAGSSGVYVVFGHTGPWENIDLTALKSGSDKGIYITTPTNAGGNSLDIINDFNGDGISDLLINSFGETAYIVFGSAGPVSNFSTAEFETSNVRGIRISGAWFTNTPVGDFNGDDMGDVAFTQATPGTNYSYSEVIVFGRQNPGNIVLQDFTTSDQNGFRIPNYTSGSGSYYAAGIGDFNNDGFDDFVFKISGFPNGCYLLYGHASNQTDFSPAATGYPFSKLLTSDYSDFNYFQQHDLNSDGFSDAVFDSGDGPVSVVLGFANPPTSFDPLALSTPDKRVEITGVPSGSIRTARAFDVNGDGRDDLMVQSEAGVSVIYGKPSEFMKNLNASSLSPADGFTLAEPNLAKGYRRPGFSGVGDVNGDGFGDVVVGESLYDNANQVDIGTNYLIFGKASPTAAEGWELY